MIRFVTHGSFMLSGWAMDISASHLRELQRFAEVGRISAGLIHDMSGPLTAAILHLEHEDPRSLANVRHARRSMQVLERYIEAARRQLRQQDKQSIFSIKREVCQARQILMPLAHEQGVTLQFRLYHNGTLRGDPVKFQRIITNLVRNAIDAYQDVPPGNGPLIRVTVSARRRLLSIRVRDWGTGIKPEQLPWLFEPFYTTKTGNQSIQSGGTGIGLYNVRRYVEKDFGGTITAVSSPAQGTEFRLVLPLALATP